MDRQRSQLLGNPEFHIEGQPIFDALTESSPELLSLLEGSFHLLNHLFSVGEEQGVDKLGSIPIESEDKVPELESKLRARNQSF